MTAYVLTLQHSKDPKDKTGVEIHLSSPNDYDAIVHANERMSEMGYKQGQMFHIHLKQCHGRTVSYQRGF